MRMLTTEQVAELMMTHPNRLKNLRHRGEGPPFLRLGERSIRYPEDKLRAWIEAETASASGGEASNAEGR